MKLHIKATAISFLSITIASGLVSLPAFAKDVPSEPVKLYRDGSSELGGIYADSLTGSYAQRIGDLDLGRSAYVRAWERNKDNKDLFDRAIHANIILGNVDEAIAPMHYWLAKIKLPKKSLMKKLWVHYPPNHGHFSHVISLHGH